MYHCGAAPVLMHIGSGMYGAIVVSPREALPPAKELVLVQGEYYLAEAANGTRASDQQKMPTTLPDFVAFNGRNPRRRGATERTERATGRRPRGRRPVAHRRCSAESFKRS